MGLGSVGFIGCLHFGHEGMARWRGFESSKEHDEYLINNWNKVVDKRDLIYILGDITMENPNYYCYLDELKGTKKVVLGNHDLGKDVPELLKYVDTVSGMVDYKGFALTHCPISHYELQFYPKGNIHAHIHHINTIPPEYYTNDYGKGKFVFDTNGLYYNVDAKIIDFTPKTIEQLISKDV